MKRKMEIQQVRARSKITYAGAVKNQRGGTDERSRAGKQTTKESDQANKGKNNGSFK